MQVGLPDQQGREEIFNVHIAGFLRHGALGRDVIVSELARLTPNFTGADIEGKSTLCDK